MIVSMLTVILFGQGLIAADADHQKTLSITPSPLLLHVDVAQVDASCSLCENLESCKLIGLKCEDNVHYFHPICLQVSMEEQSPHVPCSCPTCHRSITAEEFIAIFGAH